MSNEIINVSKYGFILNTESKLSKNYIANVKDEIAEMVVSNDIYTIKIAGKRNIMVANRYKVSTQEQLDFILINGRVGVLFSSFSSPN